MAEYIDKAEVLEIINVMPQDLVYEHIYELKGFHIDIVHCKEYKHCEDGYCTRWGDGYYDNFFCANGERKTDV